MLFVPSVFVYVCHRLIDSGKSELSDALVQAAKSEEQIKKNESAAGSLRGRLAHVSGLLTCPA